VRFTFSLFPLRLKLRQDLPEKAVIRKKAHALTVLTGAWIGVSAFAYFGYKSGKEDGDSSWVSAAIWVWRAHAVFALMALLFWLIEKPSEVRYIKEPADHEPDA
jgi:hypothetical protein